LLELSEDRSNISFGALAPEGDDRTRFTLSLRVTIPRSGWEAIKELANLESRSKGAVVSETTRRLIGKAMRKMNRLTSGTQATPSPTR
jgi:hypothetical protein